MAVFRYIKVNGSLLWGEHELTKDMLVRVKQNQYDTIIDLHTMTYYDPDDNEWKTIQGNPNKEGNDE